MASHAIIENNTVALNGHRPFQCGEYLSLCGG